MIVEILMLIEKSAKEPIWAYVVKIAKLTILHILLLLLSGTNIRMYIFGVTISVFFFGTKLADSNKTKETLVPTAARYFRAQSKEYRMLEGTSLLIASKLAIEIFLLLRLMARFLGLCYVYYYG